MLDSIKGSLGHVFIMNILLNIKRAYCRGSNITMGLMFRALSNIRIIIVNQSAINHMFTYTSVNSHRFYNK